MADANNIEVKFGASTEGLEAGAQKAASAIASSTAEMKASFASLESTVKATHAQITGAMDGISAGFAKFNGILVGVTAALAGTGAVKAFVNDSLALTASAAGMGKALGITATEASYLKSALTGAGVSQDTMMAGANKITMTLSKNEDAFKKLGVATRDSNGDFRSTSEVMMDANSRLRDFKEGTDRNVEGMKIYGRSWQEISPMVTKFTGISEEARKTAEDLNLVVGQEAVDAMGKYKLAQRGVGEVMEGIKNTIGEALMPRLTGMAEWFRSVGPAAVEATRIAMAGYLGIQDAVKDSVLALWNAVKDAFSAIGKVIAGVFGQGGSGLTAMELFANVIKVIQVAFIGLSIGIQEAIAVIKYILEGLIITATMVANVIGLALKGDFSGAKAAWTQHAADQKALLEKSAAEALQIAVEGAAKIDAAINADLGGKKKVTESKKPKDGERSEGKDKPVVDNTKDEGMVAKYEKENKLDKENFELHMGLQTRALEADVEFWQSKLENASKTNGDSLKIEEKISAAKLAVMKKLASDNRALSTEEINFDEKKNLNALELLKVSADRKLALGMMTQAQMIQFEMAFEQQKTQIAATAQLARAKLVEADPSHSPAALKAQKDKLLEIEMQYEVKKSELAKKAAIEEAQYGKQFETGMVSGFAGVLKTFATGSMSIQSLFKNMGQAILSSMIDVFAQIAAKKLAMMLMMTAGEKISALARVTSEAGVAGAAGVASAAAIPVTGWAMAPAAGAATFAAAMAYAPVASASGGFDIPAGLNPITQLHAQEMVLPKAQADAVRDMANGGGGGGGGQQIHIHATDAQSVARLFRDNGEHLVAALQKQRRNLAF